MNKIKRLNILILIILCLTSCSRDKIKYGFETKNWSESSSSVPYVPNEWLVKQLTFEELFNSNDIGVYWKHARNNFQSILIEGDEIWKFSSPLSTWKELSGVEGYTIIRNNKAVAGFITRLN